MRELAVVWGGKDKKELCLQGGVLRFHELVVFAGSNCIYKKCKTELWVGVRESSLRQGGLPLGEVGGLPLERGMGSSL